MPDWAIFVLGVISFQIIKMLALSFNQWVIERRQHRVFRLIEITFPGRKAIKFVAADSSDKRAMANIERQIREEYGAPEQHQQDGSADRGRDRGPRPDSPRSGQDAPR